MATIRPLRSLPTGMGCGTLLLPRLAGLQLSLGLLRASLYLRCHRSFVAGMTSFFEHFAENACWTDWFGGADESRVVFPGDQ